MVKRIEPDALHLTYDHPYKHAEQIGRLCYESEHLIKEDSYKGFIQRAIEKEHFAMLEHATFAYQIPASRYFPEEFMSIPGVWVDNLHGSRELFFSLSHLYNPKYKCDFFDAMRLIIEDRYDFPSTENLNPKEDVKLSFVRQSEGDYGSIVFTTDRAITHEIVRHRAAMMERSTRYIALDTQKYGMHVPFSETVYHETASWGARMIINFMTVASDWSYKALRKWFHATPEQAREVLIFPTQSRVVMTAPESQWRHFMNLRLYGKTGAPHPDMVRVAGLAYPLLKQHFGWN